MAELLKNGKWAPVVFRDGFVYLMELTNENKWQLVERDTKEEAEAEEKRYSNMWK
jgi:hypothetical protein